MWKVRNPSCEDAPDGEATQSDTNVMRVACQASASVAGAWVGTLAAEGEDEGQDIFEERLALMQQVIRGRCIVAIGGDRAVVPRLGGCCGPYVTPYGQLTRL
jgi:hypothetical protein